MSSWIWFVAFMPIITILAYLGFTYFTGNIWVFNKGKFIRSAQLSEDKFVKLMKRYKPKAMINFRGSDRKSVV